MSDLRETLEEVKAEAWKAIKHSSAGTEKAGLLKVIIETAILLNDISFDKEKESEL